MTQVVNILITILFIIHSYFVGPGHQQFTIGKWHVLYAHRRKFNTMRETSIDHLNSNEGIKTIFAFSRSSRNQRSLEIKGPASLHNANYARLQYSDVTV